MLAPLLNYGEVNGQLFVVHPYHQHGSLLSQEGRRRFNSPLPVEVAFTYALQLARVLAYIHISGYIHGSLPCLISSSRTRQLTSRRLPILPLS